MQLNFFLSFRKAQNVSSMRFFVQILNTRLSCRCHPQKIYNMHLIMQMPPNGGMWIVQCAACEQSEQMNGQTADIDYELLHL